MLPVILWTRNRFPPEIAPAACPLRACLPCCACGRRGCRACGRERRPAFPADRLPVQSSQGLPGKLFPLAPSAHLWERSVFAASWGGFFNSEAGASSPKAGEGSPVSASKDKASASSSVFTEAFSSSGSFGREDAFFTRSSRNGYSRTSNVPSLICRRSLWAKGKGSAPWPF